MNEQHILHRKISLKSERIMINSKKKNHQRTPLEKYAVKQKKIF